MTTSPAARTPRPRPCFVRWRGRSLNRSRSGSSCRSKTATRRMRCCATTRWARARRGAKNDVYFRAAAMRRGGFPSAPRRDAAATTHRDWCGPRRRASRLMRTETPPPSGEAGLAVYNLASSAATVAVDLPPALTVGQNPIDLLSGAPVILDDAHAVFDLPGHGYTFIGGFNLGGYTSHGYLNCFAGQGAGYAPNDPIASTSLANCFDACGSDGKCDGATVKWLADGLVDCYLRGDITLGDCEANDKDAYTTFTAGN
mmetsp:Transcript_13763/g.41271  ORF Transcript_13763/g.41271 Transcript_13763/m.41271 type:complete len:257 (-) Transcript_13763:110-880(-)